MGDSLIFRIYGLGGFVRVGAQGVRGWLMVGTGMLWFFDSEVLGFLVCWFFVLLD